MGYSNSLHVDEIERLGFITLDFQAKLDGLLDPIHQIVEGFCLDMAALQGGGGSHVVSLAISTSKCVCIMAPT
jgi:hypothetical protein